MFTGDNERPHGMRYGFGRDAAVGLALVLVVCKGAVARRQPQAQAQSPQVPANALYKDTKQPVEMRVRDLLGRMTVEEKVSLLSGANWMESVEIARLGITAIKMADGPVGVRAWYGPSALTN